MNPHRHRHSYTSLKTCFISGLSLNIHSRIAHLCHKHMSLLESRTKNRWENPKDQERQVFGFSGSFYGFMVGSSFCSFLNSVFEAGLLSHIGFHIRSMTGQFYGMVVFGSIRFGLKVQCAVFGRL